MTKLKVPLWNSVGKELVVKTEGETVALKATTSLFARLLVIARSSRESVDLEELIGEHELSNTNRILLKPNGMIIPTADNTMSYHYWRAW